MGVNFPVKCNIFSIGNITMDDKQNLLSKFGVRVGKITNKGYVAILKMTASKRSNYLEDNYHDLLNKKENLDISVGVNYGIFLKQRRNINRAFCQ